VITTAPLQHEGEGGDKGNLFPDLCYLLGGVWGAQARLVEWWQRLDGTGCSKGRETRQKSLLGVGWVIWPTVRTRFSFAMLPEPLSSIIHSPLIETIAAVADVILDAKNDREHALPRLLGTAGASAENCRIQNVRAHYFFPVE